MQATMTVGPSGAPGPMTIKLPGRSHNDLRAAVESVIAMLPQVFVTVPEEAIGVGSKWKATAPVELAELHLQQATTYEVLTRNAQGVEVSVDAGYSHTPGAVACDSRQVKKLDVTVKGKLSFDPTKLVADRGEATLHLE